jgi:hypothetical protein
MSNTAPEPVAWAYVNSDGECEQIEWGGLPNDPSITPLYLHPPRKLPTREEVKVAIEDAIYSGGQSAFLEHATNAIMALFDAPHGAGGE